MNILANNYLTVRDIWECQRLLTQMHPHPEMCDEEYFLLYPSIENPNSPDEIELQELIKERHGN